MSDMNRDGLDREAFERIYRRYYISLYRFAYDFLDDEQASRDVVSDVFTRLWGDHGNVSMESVGSFLYVSVRNRCINIIRRRQTSEKYERWLKASVEHEPDEILPLVDERIEAVRAEIGKMSAKTRMVLERCYLDGRTYKEVANEMGITADGVKKHITKAFAALREHFGIKNLNKVP